MLMDFGQAYGLGAGRKREGRPMVWETREVREEANHSQFASLHLVPLLPTNVKNVSGPAPMTAAPPTYTPHKYATPPRHQRSPHCRLSCRYLPPKPSHPFACMPAWTPAAAGVRLACSAMRRSCAMSPASPTNASTYDPGQRKVEIANGCSINPTQC